MTKLVALTTVDNPFDPFTQFDAWFQFDLDKERNMIDENGERIHLNCCSYLDRIANTSEQLSDSENIEEIERAIDEIIKYDFTNTYKKIVKIVE